MASLLAARQHVPVGGRDLAATQWELRDLDARRHSGSADAHAIGQRGGRVAWLSDGRRGVEMLSRGAVCLAATIALFARHNAQPNSKNIYNTKPH